MSSPEPSFNGNASSSPAQRLVIAVGTLIVVALTVVAAVLLAIQPPSNPTVTPTLPTQTSVTVTFTPALRPTDTPGLSSTPTPTKEPTQTPAAPTATDTPVPQPPTLTMTPVVVIVTPTLPSTTTLTPIGTPGVCRPPSAWIAYTVQAGDTLNSLSARTGLSVYDLQQVNCLQTFTIQPGQVIYLPFEPPSPTPTATSTPVTPSPTASVTPTGTPTPRPPEIFEINISLARDILTIRGRNFEPNGLGFRVEITGLSGTMPPLELGQLRSNTGFEAKIPSTLPGGDYDLRVINPDGQFAQRRITVPSPP